jgi:hypothetical protein
VVVKEVENGGEVRKNPAVNDKITTRKIKNLVNTTESHHHSPLKKKASPKRQSAFTARRDHVFVEQFQKNAFSR